MATAPAIVPAQARPHLRAGTDDRNRGLIWFEEHARRAHPSNVHRSAPAAGGTAGSLPHAGSTGRCAQGRSGIPERGRPGCPTVSPLLLGAPRKCAGFGAGYG